VQADFVVIDGETEMRRENISIADLDHLTAPYPLATRAGQFIFTTPLAGVDPKTNLLARSFDDLTAEELELLEPPYSRPEEMSAAQHVMVFRHIRRILESQGAPLGSHIHQNCWLRIPMQEWGPSAKVRRQLFQGAENMAPSTALPVSGVYRRDACFEVEVIALVPSDEPGAYRKEVRIDPHPLTGFYLSAVNAGPLVLTAGEVAIDTSVPRFLNRFDQLDDEGRSLPYGRIHEEKPIMVESWHVYSRLKEYVEASGASMDDVVHQAVYMVNPDEYPALERIAALFYGSRLPPTTVVPVLGATPYRQATLEIEVVAVTDGG
jgi:enamine deaminase RidA (YjgF/YER057c/UK114 family)